MIRKNQFMLKDRIAYKYLEHCNIAVEKGEVLIASNDSKESLPYGRYAVIMLGPSCTITHAAVSAISQTGCDVLWCSNSKTHLYQFGSPLSGSTKYLIKQARICSNERLSLQAAKRMFSIRYPDENTSFMTSRQLLSFEGKKMRELYRKIAEKYNIEWSGRYYNYIDYDSNDPIQKAITITNQCLYAVVQAVILSIGLSPGLGIIHKTNERAFVFDIADLYKEKITLPYAFKHISEEKTINEKKLYEELEIIFEKEKIIMQIIRDIKIIFVEQTK